MGKPHRTAKAKSQKPRRRPTRAGSGHGGDARPFGSAPARSAPAGSFGGVAGLGGMPALGAFGGPTMASLETYAEPFLQWLLDDPDELSDADDPDDAEAEAAAKAPIVWAAVQGVCLVAAENGLSSDPARWSPEDLDDLLTAVGHTFNADDQEGDATSGAPGTSGVVMSSLLLFLGFLGETDRWQGSPAQLAAMITHLTIAADPDSEIAQLAASLRTGVDVTASAEDTAVATLPLVADFVELLTVTARRRQAELAGEIGEDEGPSLEEAMTALTAADDDPLAVSHLWTTALWTQLVDIDGRAASLTETGEALAASPAEAIEDTWRVVLAWLGAAVTMPSVLTTDSELVAALDGLGPAFLGPVLAMGLTPKPLSSAGLDAALAAVTDGVPAQLREAAQGRLRALLGRLLRSGVLSLQDDRYVVPAGLESLLLQVMQILPKVEESTNAAS